jgi:hypothetical protein
LLLGTLIIVTCALADLTIFVIALIIARMLLLFVVTRRRDLVNVYALSCQPPPTFDAPVAS